MANLATFAGPGVAIDFGGNGTEPSLMDDHEFMEPASGRSFSGEAHSTRAFASRTIHRHAGPLWEATCPSSRISLERPIFRRLKEASCSSKKSTNSPMPSSACCSSSTMRGYWRNKSDRARGFCRLRADPRALPLFDGGSDRYAARAGALPVLTGLPFGHVARNSPCPSGATVRLDIGPGSYSLEFPARLKDLSF